MKYLMCQVFIYNSLLSLIKDENAKIVDPTSSTGLRRGQRVSSNFRRLDYQWFWLYVLEVLDRREQAGCWLLARKLHCRHR